MGTKRSTNKEIQRIRIHYTWPYLLMSLWIAIREMGFTVVAALFCFLLVGTSYAGALSLPLTALMLLFRRFLIRTL